MLSSMLDDIIRLAAKGTGVMRPGDIGYDPRFGTRKGDIPRMNELEVTRESLGNQILTPLRADDVEGRGLIFTEADRSAAGGSISQINDTPLQSPVRLYGGQGYPLDNPGRGFASGRGIVTNLINKASAMKDAAGGKNPLLVPFVMAPTGNDFATMTGSTMLSYAQSALPKKIKNSIDKAIKQIDEDWAGLDSPMMIERFQSLGAGKRKQIQAMMDRDFRDQGGLSLPEARLAISDALQLDAKDLSARNFIEIDPDKARIPTNNPSYDLSMIGEYKGTAQAPISVLDLAADYSAKRGITGDKFAKSSGDVRANEQYSLKQTRPTQKPDSRVIDALVNRGAALGIPAVGILGALGMPDRATAGSTDSIVPGGLTAPSMADVRSAMEQSGSGSQDVQQFILDALLGFAAPQSLGDATMTGRSRNATR
jgi:hypothetical protein